MRRLSRLPRVMQVVIALIASLVIVAVGQGVYDLLAHEPFHFGDFAVLAAVGAAYGLFMLWRDRRSAADASEANPRESEETK